MVCTFCEFVNTSMIHMIQAKFVQVKQSNFVYPDLVNLNIRHPLKYTRAKTVDAHCVWPPNKTFVNLEIYHPCFGQIIWKTYPKISRFFLPKAQNSSLNWNFLNVFKKLFKWPLNKAYCWIFYVLQQSFTSTFFRSLNTLD